GRVDVVAGREHDAAGRGRRVGADDDAVVGFGAVGPA
ncbi:MAG: hypothetical protein AVDCRST_MAG85-429, partial [uncultured Solirubrobacteraceae bacterium]